MKSTGELAKALYWTGERRKSEHLIEEMFNTSVNTSYVVIVE